MSKKIRVLSIQPLRKPIVKDIPDDLASLQKEVQGDIQAIYPFEDRVALICNEEGKLFQLPPNRALRTKDGTVYDIVVGDFLIAGIGEENFCSLSDDLIEKYTKLYETPDLIIQAEGRIVVFPMKQ